MIRLNNKSVDKNHVYTAEEIFGCIVSFIMNNSLWNELNEKPTLFLLKDIKSVSKTSTVITCFHGEQFKITVEKVGSKEDK